MGQAEEQTRIMLPIQVSTKVDVGRLMHEAEALDNFLTQSAIREPGTAVKLPKTSRLMDEFIGANKLNPLHEKDRRKMLDFISKIRTGAPVIHMSFGADPSTSFVQKITTWLRQEIHPYTLLHIGLQPNIGAGCVVRTTNKQFDFSLRQHFRKQRPLLIDKLHGGIAASVEVPSNEGVAEQS